MSKDIWHTAKEKPMLHRDIILCGNGWSMAIDIIPETVNNICWENVEKWCYLEDLLALETKLERTRKALDVALDKLKRIQKIYTNAPFNAPINYANVCTDMYDVATEQITALEQKDVK